MKQSYIRKQSSGVTDGYYARQRKFIRSGNSRSRSIINGYLKISCLVVAQLFPPRFRFEVHSNASPNPCRLRHDCLYR